MIHRDRSAFIGYIPPPPSAYGDWTPAVRGDWTLVASGYWIASPRWAINLS